MDRAIRLSTRVPYMPLELVWTQHNVSEDTSRSMSVLPISCKVFHGRLPAQARVPWLNPASCARFIVFHQDRTVQWATRSRRDMMTDQSLPTEHRRDVTTRDVKHTAMHVCVKYVTTTREKHNRLFHVSKNLWTVIQLFERAGLILHADRL